MLWKEVREKHPSKWLVLEALKFHQMDDKFVIEDFELLSIFDKPVDAYTEYRSLHRQHPNKEILFADAEMPVLEIPTSYRAITFNGL